MSLEELLERYFASDDEAAMAELVRETRGKLLAVARRICRDDAEDAVQTAYLSLAKRGGSGGAPVLPWLLTAVARIAYRAKATRAKEHAIAERLAPSAAPPEPPEIAVGREEAELLRRELWKLPDDYRDTLQLRYLHGLSGADVARLLGVNESTVRTRLQRGRLLLRSRLARVMHPFLALPWLLNDAGASVVLAVGGTMKVKLVLVALLLAVLGTFHATTRARAPATRAVPVAAASPPLPSGEQATTPLADEIETRRHEPQPASVTAEERARYLEWRRVSELFGMSRRALRESEALIKALGGEQEEAVPLADAATASYLADLIREYRSLPAGAERQERLARIVETQREYLESTHDGSFLGFLEDVIRGSPVEAERELAVPDAGAGTMDLLLRLADHPDPAVRAAVVRSLAQSGDARAVAVVVRGLEDDASVVRWAAAIELEYGIADPVHVPALLDRVAHETHPLAADSLVRAISSLDPEGGPRRIEHAVAMAPEAVRAAVLTAVTMPGIQMPADTTGAAKVETARADEGTKAYLERLLGEYRSLPEGRERLAILEKLAKAHADYLERSGEAELLAALAGIARSSRVEDERVVVVRSFTRTRDRRVVDLLVELKGSDDVPVRGAVAATLAWVQGVEAGRARQALLDLLGDPAPSVRRTAALLVHTPLRDPGNVPRLLSGLRVETDLLAAYAMIDAVLRLDPETGAERVAAARSEASLSTQSVIDSALALHAGRRER